MAGSSLLVPAPLAALTPTLAGVLLGITAGALVLGLLSWWRRIRH